jgi:hypothetical protein
MYYEGSRQLRPNERPFALHRNSQAGMQRYAAFLWSGDVYSTWETLKNARAGGRKHGIVRHSLPGHGHWWFCADEGIHRRVACPLVPVRRVLPAVPRSWTNLAPALPWGWNTGELRKRSRELHRRRG